MNTQIYNPNSLIFPSLVFLKRYFVEFLAGIFSGHTKNYDVFGPDGSYVSRILETIVNIRFTVSN